MSAELYQFTFPALLSFECLSCSVFSSFFFFFSLEDSLLFLHFMRITLVFRVVKSAGNWLQSSKIWIGFIECIQRCSHGNCCNRVSFLWNVSLIIFKVSIVQLSVFCNIMIRLVDEYNMHTFYRASKTLILIFSLAVDKYQAESSCTIYPFLTTYFFRE